MDGSVTVHHGCFQAVHQAVEDCIELAVFASWKNGAEFIPARARYEVGSAEIFGELVSGVFQDGVARVVTEGVVDGFEVIDVNDDECDGESRPLGCGNGNICGSQKAGPAGDAC